MRSPRRGINWKRFEMLMYSWICVISFLNQRISFPTWRNYVIQPSISAIWYLWGLSLLIFLIIGIQVMVVSSKGQFFQIAEGLLSFMVPTRLGNAFRNFDLWRDVGRQTVLQLVVGQSTLLSLSSFNNFHEPILTSSVIVGIITILFNLTSSMMTYSLLGIFGHKLNIPTEAFIRDQKNAIPLVS